jgi:hypothetical protein
VGQQGICFLIKSLTEKCKFGDLKKEKVLSSDSITQLFVDQTMWMETFLRFPDLFPYISSEFQSSQLD